MRIELRRRWYVAGACLLFAPAAGCGLLTDPGDLPAGGSTTVSGSGAMRLLGDAALDLLHGGAHQVARVRQPDVELDHLLSFGGHGSLP